MTPTSLFCRACARSWPPVETTLRISFESLGLSVPQYFGFGVSVMIFWFGSTLLMIQGPPENASGLVAGQPVLNALQVAAGVAFTSRCAGSRPPKNCFQSAYGLVNTAVTVLLLSLPVTEVM